MVFFSYSRADINNVRPIVERLRRSGVDCWLDESNIPVGEAFVVQLGEALARASVFVLIDTPASRSSYWVKREKITALRIRAERRTFVVARMFLPELADSGESWDVSVPLTLAGEASFLGFLNNQKLKSVSDKPIQLPAGGRRREISFGQPQNWSGRQADLEQLDNWWLGSKEGVWICGLGGNGKSGLIQTWLTALEYLGYDSAQAVGIFFITGREIISSLRSGSPLRDFFLKRAIGFQHSLVVLDGFNEAMDSVFAEQLLREALAYDARVIVSSRGNVPEPLLDSFMTINLYVISRRDAVAFLAQTGIIGEDALAVAEELGDHPLAVLLFSRYVAKRNLKPAEALERLRRQRRQRWLHDISGHDGLGSTISMIVELSIASVSQVAQKVLLDICRFDVPDLKWPECVPATIAVSDALAGVQELAVSGLVQIDRLDAPAHLAIHDLVRDFVKSRYEVDGCR